MYCGCGQVLDSTDVLYFINSLGATSWRNQRKDYSGMVLATPTYLSGLNPINNYFRPVELTLGVSYFQRLTRGIMMIYQSSLGKEWKSILYQTIIRFMISYFNRN